MSYLRTPRLIFSGAFRADPSTVNNDPNNFDTANFQLNDATGSWNPNGTGAWRLVNCVVKSVVYADGTTCTDPQVDPIVGTPLTDDTTGVEAKLVDLDSENQMTSQIWGLKVIVGNTTSGLGFSGNYAVASFLDLFKRFTSGANGDTSFGAAFQSVLQPIQWAGSGTSRFLKELSANGTPSQLSIKFNVDGFDDDRNSTNFTFGRIVGSIGLQLAGEPSFFVAGRVLDPVSPSPLSSAYAEIVDKTLTIDLGNSLTTQSAGGPLVDHGVLNVVILQAGRAHEHRCDY